MIRDAFKRVMELQAHYSFRKSPEMDERGTLVEKAIPEWLKRHASILNSTAHIPDLEFDGAHQMGNSSRVPYIRLFSKSKSPRAPIGWYCVFLFDEIGDCVYLTLGHGSTDPDKNGQKRSLEEIVKLVNWGLGKLPPINEIGPRLVNSIDLKSQPGRLGKAYEQTTLLAYKYDIADLPDDSQLITDIQKLLSLLKILYEAEDSDPTLPGAISPESEMAKETMFQAAGRRLYKRRYGGIRLSTAESNVIENWAITKAIEYLRAQGWLSIEDVGAIESYDLHCKRGEEMLYVEVKGTQSNGEKVVLTRNEVRLHRKEFPNNALIVVKEISLVKGDTPTASGGVVIVISPWTIEESDLDAIGFDYTVPAS